MIRVFELQGPVFFGSADRLSRAIESDLGKAGFCILDIHHVSDIDATGAAILLRLHKRLAKSGRLLLISHLKDGESRQALLTPAGVLEQIGARHLFPDTDARPWSGPKSASWPTCAFWIPPNATGCGRYRGAAGFKR